MSRVAWKASFVCTNSEHMASILHAIQTSASAEAVYPLVSTAAGFDVRAVYEEASRTLQVRSGERHAPPGDYRIVLVAQKKRISMLWRGPGGSHRLPHLFERLLRMSRCIRDLDSLMGRASRVQPGLAWPGFAPIYLGLWGPMSPWLSGP